MRKKTCYVSLLVILVILPFYIYSELPILHNEYHAGFNSVDQLKVMTFNIRGARKENGEVELSQIIQQIRNLDPDILALQEVDFRLPRSNYQNQVEIIGTQLKMNYLFIPNLNFVIGSYGNAILSKFPITNYEYHPLPSGREARGFIYAQINTGIQTVDVYATHLGLSLEERINQISSLTQVMSLSSSPKLLLGDFNSNPTEVPIQSLRSLYSDPAHEQNLQLTTYEYKEKSLQLDYIFFSQDFSFDSAITEQSLTSDHNPLMYSLSLAELSEP